MADRETVMMWLKICGMGDCSECCPYRNGEVRASTCYEQLMMDALSLLKAQEPRVMDADEIVLSAEPSGWLWLEMKNGHCGESFKAGRTISGWINFGNGFDPSFASFLPKEYGKTWRCWTSRPTEEEREKVKWDE